MFERLLRWVFNGALLTCLYFFLQVFPLWLAAIRTMRGYDSETMLSPGEVLAMPELWGYSLAILCIMVLIYFISDSLEISLTGDDVKEVLEEQGSDTERHRGQGRNNGNH